MRLSFLTGGPFPRGFRPAGGRASAACAFPLRSRSVFGGTIGLFGLLLLAGCDGGTTAQQETLPSTDPTAASSSEDKLFDLGPAVPAVPSPPATAQPAADHACPEFVDVGERVGLDFVYQTGAQGKSLMVETMGGGCGVLDYDRDGRSDFYFCQGGDPSAAAGAAGQPADRLYRQLAGGEFAALPAAAFPETGFRYGQGVTVGDFDHDGFADIYVTNVGGNVLWQNRGDGTFRNATQHAGVGDPRWSSSAAFADLNADGLLDLFVCNYVAYDPRNPIDCRNEAGEFRICHPREIDPYPNAVFLNRGDGQFEEAAAPLGLTGAGSKSLGVAIADFNRDALPDIYVANDTTANFLFVNQGGRFDEQGLLQACAVDRNGAYQASMGLAVGDYDGDGWQDLYVSHFYEESNTLYRNLGDQGFQDVTGFVGLHDPTMLRLGFGTVMRDFNQDGWQDLFITNGHIENYPGNTLHRMRPQLFSYTGGGFTECTARAGPFFQRREVGRGVAAADFDHDGDVDLVVVHQDAPVALLQNQAAHGDWLKLTFAGRQSNRAGIGCQVQLRRGETTWRRELTSGGSYASAHEASLLFGLGEASGPLTVEVRWPSGIVQQIDQVTPNQTLHVVEPVGGSEAAPVRRGP